MKSAVIVLACVISCAIGRAPDCVSACGMAVFNMLPDAGQTCSSFQGAEDLALEAFKATNDARLRQCSALHGWDVEMQPSINFVSWNELVSGRTICALNTMYVNARPFNQSSLPHEMAHAMQKCQPLPPVDEQDKDHSNWLDGGIYGAIARVNATP